MASIKKLKKDINNSIGSFIEDVYLWELNNPKSDIKKSEALIDESIDLFDRLISKVKISDKVKVDAETTVIAKSWTKQIIEQEVTIMCQIPYCILNYLIALVMS